MTRHKDTFQVIEVAQAEAARARGWMSLGDSKRAEAALDRAMVALTRAEDDCPTWARDLLERLHDELDSVEVARD
ncbi:MAG TPA: hypothetical protein VIY27_07885 [Myxococcota bacterium]